MGTKLSDFRRESSSRVWVAPFKKDFNYSDGDEEEARILARLQSASDLSSLSNELESSVWDWPSEYHLTQKRANLLRHLPFQPGMKILELGGGCGGITRFLGESGAEVSMVEGSLNRALCAAERTRNLDNVRIHCANFGDVDFEPVYDFVVLIGVLEYAPLFWEGDDPFRSYLGKIKSALKKGGRVIIAIENRNGLKYYNGCSEDHIAKPFIGITDAYGSKEPRTFGRKELQCLLHDTGLQATEFHYPFPDYKLPTVVVTEQGFNTPAFIPEGLLCQTASRDYCLPHTPLFREAMAWPQLVANKMAEDMANSFLVLASETQLEPICKGGLAYSYNLGERPDYLRKNAYKTATIFSLTADGAEVVVDKRPLGAPPAHSCDVAHCVGTQESYATGTLLQSIMLRRLCDGDRNGFVSLVKDWMRHLLEFGSVEVATRKPSALIKPEYFECLPSNLIVTQGRMAYIDREWRFERPYKVQDLVLRGLIHLCHENRAAVSTCFPESQFAVFEIAAAAGIDIKPFDVERVQRWEDEFYRDVFEALPGREVQTAPGTGAVQLGSCAPSDRQAPRHDLDILIVTFNSAPHLAQCVAALEKELPGARIHVVDNASCDGTVQVLKSLKVASIRLNDSNRMLSHEWNRFAAESTNKYLMFINPDVVIHNGDFIAKAVEAMERDASIAVAARVHRATLGDLMSWEAPVRPDDRAVFGRLIEPSAWLRSQLDRGGDWRDIELGYADGCCFILRRDTMLQLGGFSEELPLYFNETEFSVRLLGNGKKIHPLWDNNDGNLYHAIGGSLITPPETEVIRAAPGVSEVAGDPPLISVVLPTYNQLKYLPVAIESILNQTLQDFELIIVNDGSTDGSREYLESLDDPRIVVVHQDNRKLPAALNSGFARARGELLTWTSSDNFCAPIFLEALSQALSAHPEAGFAYSAFAWIDENSRITSIHRDQNLNWHNLIGSNPGNASFMYRRECQTTLGDYDTTLEGAEDWDMWLRLVERYQVVYVPEVLYYFRTHPESMTSTKRERIGAACQTTVTKAFERLNGQIEIWKLFPWIDRCTDRERAATVACLELGNALILSPFASPELALPFLEAAFSRESRPEYLYNLSLGYAKSGHWEKAEECLEQLRGATPGNQAGDMIALLDRQCRSRSFPNPPPLFRTQRKGEELFEREDSERLVYSCTSQGGFLGEAAPPH